MSNVGYATLSIIPSAKGFGSALDGSVGGIVRKSGAKHGREYGSVYAKTAIGPLRALGGVAAGVFAVDKAKDFFTSAISQASDLHEAGTALQQVFGSATGKVVGFASGGAKALGQTRLAAEQAAQTFGVYGKAAGLGSQANAKFSDGMVQLSTDLASFYNTSPEEAMTALAAGLRGENEPLRKYGVLLNQATLQQTALRMGLIKTKNQALTPAQKVLAAHAVILKQTKVAQGDFARTSSGLANQQRILAAQWTDAKGKIGSFLLPAITAAVKGLNSLFSHVGDVSGAFSKIGGWLTPVVEAFRQFWGAFTGKGYTVKKGVLPDGTIRQLIQAGVAAYDFVQKVKGLVSEVISRAIPVFEELWTIFRTKVLPVLEEVAGFIVGTVVPTVLSIYAAVAQRLKPILFALFDTIKANVLPALASVWSHFRKWLPTIERVVKVILKVVGWLLKLAATILGKVLPPLIKFAGWLLGTLIRVIATVIGWVVKIVGAILDIPHAASQAWSWIRSTFGKIVGFVEGLPGRIARAASGMWDGITDAFRSAINWIIRGWNSLQFTLPKVNTHIPGVGTIGGWTLGTPDIPLLASGGIATAATLAVVGEAGPEAILPLDRLHSLLAQRGSSESSDATAGRAPLVGGDLVLQSRGNTHDDLEEALFTLRRISRGGRP